MRLSADTIYWYTARLEAADKVYHAGELGSRPVQTILVDVKFGAWVSLARRLEGQIDERFAQNGIEDGVA